MLPALLFVAALAPAPIVDAVPATRVLITHAPLARTMRGDYEPPDVVVVAREEPWPVPQAPLIEAAAAEVPVLVLVDDTASREDVLEELELPAPLAEDVDVLTIDLDSVWARDWGPIAVRAGARTTWLDTPYFGGRALDDGAPLALSIELDVDVEQVPWSLEGGAIISDGRGLCASTFESFGRAGIDVDEADAVDALLGSFGCRAWVLVPALWNDPTAHVDMLAQFLDARTVAVADVDPAEQPVAAERLDQAARGIVEGARRLGRTLDVVHVPTPYSDDDRPFSYVNALRLPRSLLVPSYAGVPEDEERAAHDALDRALLDVEVVPVAADDALSLSGALHCLALGLDLPR